MFFFLAAFTELLRDSSLFTGPAWVELLVKQRASAPLTAVHLIVVATRGHDAPCQHLERCMDLPPGDERLLVVLQSPCETGVFLAQQRRQDDGEVWVPIWITTQERRESSDE